jgi:hypothetical protein
VPDIKLDFSRVTYSNILEIVAPYSHILLLKAYNNMNASNQTVAGVVIVFDSADGGQIAATMENLKALQDGSLTEAAFWRLCSLDPPETFQDSAKS